MTQPVFIVVCGINGAGKSTLADALAATPELAGFTFLNPDRLSAGYRQADPALTRDLGVATKDVVAVEPCDRWFSGEG